MNNINKNNSINILDDEDDIPEITDFSQWTTKPAISESLRKGYNVIVEHDDYNEVIIIKKSIKRKPKSRSRAKA